jgi:beta-carotene 15,15'-dioxygenase
MSKRLIHISILLFVTFCAVLTKQYWIGSPVEWIFAGVLIMVAGIPHGSLDHTLAKNRNNKLNLVYYIAGYVGSSVLFLIIWLLVPGWAFILFLVLTAWHFGETDFVSFQLRSMNPGLIFMYGSTLTIWLLWQHTDVLLYWSGIIAQNSSIVDTCVRYVAMLPVEVWFITAAVILLIQKGNSFYLFAERILFVSFLFLLSKTSLIIGFVLYFSGWHSLNAMLHVRTAVFGRAGTLNMLRKAIPVTIIAFAFLFIVGWISNGSWLKEHALPALFVLLSILTLPHMTEMHRLYTNSRALES